MNAGFGDQVGFRSTLHSSYKRTSPLQSELIFFGPCCVDSTISFRMYGNLIAARRPVFLRRNCKRYCRCNFISCYPSTSVFRGLEIKDFGVQVRALLVRLSFSVGSSVPSLHREIVTTLGDVPQSAFISVMRVSSTKRGGLQTIFEVLGFRKTGRF